MLATILGHRAVEAGYRVYYTTAADLVARTAKAALEGRWATTMRFWNGPPLLIVDELGYLPLADKAASHFFQVVSRRYEHGSIVLTTNRHIADGATSSTTAPSPPPSSTVCRTTPPSCRSTATATAYPAPTRTPTWKRPHSISRASTRGHHRDRPYAPGADDVRQRWPATLSDTQRERTGALARPR
jgi:hypothetical protein